MLKTEHADTHCCTGLKAASSYIARYCGGPPWFEDPAAFEDCIKRGMGPEVERVADDGVPVFAKSDLVRFTINTFGGDPKEEMLNRYLNGKGELCWRSATAEVVLVDFND